MTPAKFRSGKFVPDRKAAQVSLDWNAVVNRFSESRSRMSLLLLRGLRPGVFVGLRTRGKKSTTFVFDAAGRSRSVAQVLKQDPTFGESIKEVFLVNEVKWGLSLEEFGPT